MLKQASRHCTGFKRLTDGHVLWRSVSCDGVREITENSSSSIVSRGFERRKKLNQ